MDEKEQIFLDKCVELLTTLGKDMTKDEVTIVKGDGMLICNPNSKFIQDFGGKSIRSIAEYAAKKLNKKIIYDRSDNE